MSASRSACPSASSAAVGSSSSQMGRGRARRRARARRRRCPAERSPQRNAAERVEADAREGRADRRTVAARVVGPEAHRRRGRQPGLDRIEMRQEVRRGRFVRLWHREQGSAPYAPGRRHQAGEEAQQARLAGSVRPERAEVLLPVPSVKVSPAKRTRPPRRQTMSSTCSVASKAPASSASARRSRGVQGHVRIPPSRTHRSRGDRRRPGTVWSLW